MQRIATRVLESPETAIFQSVTEFADAAGSSEASVIRFCRLLGFRGFQEFKLKLALDLGASSALPSRSEQANTTADIIHQLTQDSLTALSETSHLLDPEAVDRATDAILAARRVEMYGVGTSGISAQYLEHKLTRLGLASKSIQDPHLAAMSASQLGPDAVAIGVSSSGSTHDTIHTLKLARQVGAFCVAVVNHRKSPLASVAHCVLLASSHEPPLLEGAGPSKTSQFLLFEVLFSTLAKKHAGAQEAIRQTAESVVDKVF